MKPKELICRRIAKEFKNSDTVNLGAGIPTDVPLYLTKDVKVFFHNEVGILGFCAPGPDDRDPFCIDASGNFAGIVDGGSIMDSSMSFGIIRGGHLTASVLGAMQLDAEGSIANWMVPGGKFTGMGGAMDLVVGAKRVIVATEHCDRKGKSKIVELCDFPLTGYRCVSSIFSELAYIEVTPEGLVLKETAPGVTVEEVVAKTAAKLIIDPNLCEMSFN